MSCYVMLCYVVLCMYVCVNMCIYGYDRIRTSSMKFNHSDIHPGMNSFQSAGKSD